MIRRPPRSTLTEPSFPTRRSSCLLALAAGAGVAAGFAANLIRKAVMQAPTALSGNWSDALAAEHKMTLASFDKLEKTTPKHTTRRTEEHTSELQSIMRISYAVFCLKKKKPL